MARLADDYANAGTCVLQLRFHPHQQIEWLLAAVAAAQRLTDRQSECNHLGNLGRAYDSLGEPRKAIEFYEQALPICRDGAK